MPKNNPRLCMSQIKAGMVGTAISLTSWIGCLPDVLYERQTKVETDTGATKAGALNGLVVQGR